MTEQPADPVRRALVRGAAWSVPVVAMATAAPVFAASLCTKTALLPVTWSPTYKTTTQTGSTTAGVNVNVSASYTSTVLGPGSINASNMATSNVATTRDAFTLVSNGPSVSLDPNANYQTVSFVFTRPVFELTFFIDDIDRGTGYWDYVGLAATPIETPGAVLGAQVTGGGTIDANAWRTTSTGGGDNAAGQTVKVTYGNGAIGMTSLTLRFWSPIAGGLSSRTHLVRIRQMQFRTCA